MKNKVCLQTLIALNFRIPGIQVRSFERCNFVIYRGGLKGGQGDEVLIDLESIVAQLGGWSSALSLG
jgi:hypothetical protein